MAVKKEKTPEMLVMDFMTKIKNIFKKDIYIKDKLYVFGGKFSDEDVYGDIVCVLEPTYKLALESYFDPEKRLIYIDNVAEFKKEPDIHYQYIDDENIYQDLSKMYDDVMSNIHQENDWKSFSSIPTELVEKIFDDNSSVNFVNNDDDSYVILCKKMFPLVTMKSLENLFYSIHPFIDDMDVMCLDYQFTHFRMCIVYHYIKLSS